VEHHGQGVEGDSAVVGGVGVRLAHKKSLPGWKAVNERRFSRIMANIEVQRTDHGDSYEFQVTVKEGRGETRHRVTLRKADYQELVAGKASPEELVTESFRFLLEREPKESILGHFDLMVIGRYFPEYRREIVKRL
jgi:hypothetical protein